MESVSPVDKSNSIKRVSSVHTRLDSGGERPTPRQKNVSSPESRLRNELSDYSALRWDRIESLRISELKWVLQPFLQRIATPVTGSEFQTRPEQPFAIAVITAYHAAFVGVFLPGRRATQRGFP